MPHDKNGRALSAGDEVTIRAKVVDVNAGEEYCNVSLDTVEPMYPGEHKTHIVLNAKQVEKAE